jgi:hypothetical protein
VNSPLITNKWAYLINTFGNMEDNKDLWLWLNGLPKGDLEVLNV